MMIATTFDSSAIAPMMIIAKARAREVPPALNHILSPAITAKTSMMMLARLLIVF